MKPNLKSISFSRVLTALLFHVFISVAVLATLVASPKARAGECKVSQPSDETQADAFRMVQESSDGLAEVVSDFEKKTGRKLQIIVVARAGQDLRNQVVLQDVSGRSPLTLENIYRMAAADPGSMPSSDSTAPDYQLLKNVIEKKYKDPVRSLEYSHVGFLIRNHPDSDANVAAGAERMWRVRHMLRPCKNNNPKDDFEFLQQKDLNVPYLWDEGIFHFFTDNPYELKARFIVPSPELQDRLMETVFNNELIYELNSRFYNAAANWKNKTESNSNQWVLEVLAAATRPKSQVQTRADAQDVMAKMNYTPTKILFKGRQAFVNLPGAHMIAPYVTYHASEQPYYFKASIGEVISALSVEEFLKKNNLLFGSYVTRPLVKTEDLMKAQGGTPPRLTIRGNKN